MATPANWGKLVNFESGLRKPALIEFGLFSPGDNLGFVAGLPSSTNPLTITGVQNGTNLVFTVTGSLGALYVNGLRQATPGDYTLIGHTITFVVAPRSTDVMLAFEGELT